MTKLKALRERNQQLYEKMKALSDNAAQENRLRLTSREEEQLKSIEAEMDDIRAAESSDADYVGFGSIYPSPTKKVDQIQGAKGIREARALTALPLVAIGGITVERTAEVIAAGADGIAVISGLWGASDVTARAREYVAEIEWGKSLGQSPA